MTASGKAAVKLFAQLILPMTLLRLFGKMDRGHHLNRGAETVGLLQQVLQMTRIFEIDNNLQLLQPHLNLKPTAQQILESKSA
jgi:hypothetical protein